MTQRHTIAGAASTAEMPRNEVPATSEQHRHRWRIAEQQGSLSAGHCECGAAKDFLNGWDPESGWLVHRGREVSTARS